jgi:Bacterial Ig-like domain (group 3)
MASVTPQFSGRVKGTVTFYDGTKAVKTASLSEGAAKFRTSTLASGTHIMEFYGHPEAPYATKRKPKDWTRVQAELEQLKKAAPPVAPTAKDGTVEPGLSSE